MQEISFYWKNGTCCLQIFFKKKNWQKMELVRDQKLVDVPLQIEELRSESGEQRAISWSCSKTLNITTVLTFKSQVIKAYRLCQLWALPSYSMLINKIMLQKTVS